MSFTAPKFTNAGRQLQTRVIAGDTLTFTTIKLGDGTMTTEPIAALTDLIHSIITLPVHEVRRNADYADVTGVFQNAGLSSGFYWREIGIFAADPDEKKLLKMIFETFLKIRLKPNNRCIFAVRLNTLNR